MKVNGEEAGDRAGKTGGGWLRDRGDDPLRSAVLLNGEGVPRAEMDKRKLSDGDEMEIVSFVGGG